jgi:hypothetical protein
MTRWRRRFRPARAPFAVGAVAAVAAGVGTFLVVRDGEGSDSADAELPTTVAPPDRSTVVPAPLPDPCPTDPGSLAVWTAGVQIDDAGGTADAVVRFENLTSATCDLDLTDPTARVDGVEQSVRLGPDGGWGELLIGSRGSQCARVSPVRSIVLELHGNERTVPTAAVIACDDALLAFLPADAPTDRCLASDIKTAVVAAGLVVRNDGDRPCVLGELISIELASGPATSLAEVAEARPGVAIDGPVGPDVTGLGPGDVVYFQTLADPFADCELALEPARFRFAAVALDAEFPNCTFVLLGPGHPYYGSPGGPLTAVAAGAESNGDVPAVDPAVEPAVDPAVSDVEGWIAELDPFGSS